MSSLAGADEPFGLEGVSVGPGIGWVGSSFGWVVCSCEPLLGPVDLLSPWSIFGEPILFPSYRFGDRPLSVALPPVAFLFVALPLGDSDGAAGCFKTDSVPGAAGMVCFCELPVPDALFEAAPLEDDELPGAKVLGGPELEDEE
jgi:hypothetical protein